MGSLIGTRRRRRRSQPQAPSRRRSSIVTRDEALKFVEAYVRWLSPAMGGRLYVPSRDVGEYEYGWMFSVCDASGSGEPPNNCIFVLLVSRADGRMYRPSLQHIERDLERLGTNPSALRLVFEPEDLDDL